MRKYTILIISSLAGLIILSLFLIVSLAQTQTKAISATEEMPVLDIESGEKDEEIIEVFESTNVDRPQFIGRQPPADYVEPEGGGDRYDHHLAYKDTYHSNIVVIPEDIWGMDFEMCEWFHPINNHGSWHEIHQFICYAILTYYDSNVPHDYYVTLTDYDTLTDDIHNQHLSSTLIFEVQTHGKKPINICLDMYNFKINVEEGIKQKNHDCKQGCCD